MDQRVAFIADWLRDEWTMTELASGIGSVGRRPTNGSTGTRRTRRRAWPIARGRRRRTGARWRRGCARRFWRCGAGIRTGGRRNCAAILRERAAAAARGRRRARWAICCAGGRESAAAAHALRRAVDAAVGGGAGAERCLDGGFQRLVSDGGWDAVRSADGGRCLQSVRVVLSDRGAERASACGRGSSGRFASYGLPRALRTDNGSPFATTGAGAAVASGRLVVEARDSAGSD